MAFELGNLGIVATLPSSTNRKYNCRQVVSAGTNKRKRDLPCVESSDETPTRKVLYYEPYVKGKDGDDRPLWLHNLEAGDEERVDSSWPSVVTMQWREIKQLPLATFEALHHLEQPDFRCPKDKIDRDFMKSGRAVAMLKQGWEQTLEINAFAYVCELTSAEKGKGQRKRDGFVPTINFDAGSQIDLRDLVFSAADGHLEYIGDFKFTATELQAR